MQPLKPWLDWWFPPVVPGNEAFLIRGRAYKIEDTKIDAIHDEHIHAAGMKFVLARPDDPYLTEYGADRDPALLFVSSADAHDFAERRRLSDALIEKSGAWAAAASMKRLEYAVAVISGRVPEDAIPERAMWRRNVNDGGRGPRPS